GGFGRGGGEGAIEGGELTASAAEGHAIGGPPGVVDRSRVAFGARQEGPAAAALLEGRLDAGDHVGARSAQRLDALVAMRLELPERPGQGPAGDRFGAVFDEPEEEDGAGGELSVALAPDREEPRLEEGEGLELDRGGDAGDREGFGDRPFVQRIVETEEEARVLRHRPEAAALVVC